MILLLITSSFLAGTLDNIWNSIIQSIWNAWNHEKLQIVSSQMRNYWQNLSMIRVPFKNFYSETPSKKIFWLVFKHLTFPDHNSFKSLSPNKSILCIHIYFFIAISQCPLNYFIRSVSQTLQRMLFWKCEIRVWVLPSFHLFELK